MLLWADNGLNATMRHQRQSLPLPTLQPNGDRDIK